ncbi:MAG TPA: SurA N-terminal domain-containing protein [Pirellulales bacterium]|nr:SurA N-terminal domain-containing protein [Pirellulales bacterium]
MKYPAVKMSSPFNVFRKHQKAMYALLAIMCMVGFSIGGLVSMDSDRMQQSQDPVVATAYDHALRVSEVRQLMHRRRLATSFLAECWTVGAKMPANFAEIFAQQIAARMFGPATEEAVVEMWVLDERARRMGMVVSDGAINKFLRDFTNDQVKPQVFNDIVKRQGATQTQLFEALRGELMAKRLREISLAGAGQSTPAQRWDYYRRQKQRASVEVAPVRVEDFIGEVADAPTEDLQAFFDAHKEQEPDPASPTPGFKEPKKAAFQVVVAQFENFLDEAAVTEDEIKEHYEKFKDTRYLWDQYALSEDEDESEPDEEKKPSESDQKEPAEKAADDGAKADSDEATDREEKPADEQGGDQKAGENKKPQSSLWRAKRHVAELFAGPTAAIAGLLAADEDEPSADTKPSPDVEKPVDANDKPDASPDDTGKPADADKDGDAAKSADEPATGKKPKTTKRPAAAPPITDEYLLRRDIRQGPHPKHAPLWKVENEIRKELAREKANKKIDAALQVVREKMRKFSRHLDPEEAEAKMPGLDKSAKAQGLTEMDTGMLTEREFKEKYTDLAEARGDQGSAAFLLIAYRAMAKFQSTTVQDIEGNRYLVWKTEEVDAYVPEFADVRSKVLRAWKMTKARDLALAKAKKLAEEANQSGKPLKDLLADREGLTVAQTPAFSWLTRGSANADNRSPLRISEVEGVEAPGADFMREVFSLGVGSAGEAMNEPQTAAYVVRVVSVEPSREVLRAGFLADPYPLYNEVAQEDQAEVQRAWIKGIEAEAHLAWKDTDGRRRSE